MVDIISTVEDLEWPRVASVEAQRHLQVVDAYPVALHPRSLTSNSVAPGLLALAQDLGVCGFDESLWGLLQHMRATAQQHALQGRRAPGLKPRLTRFPVAQAVAALLVPMPCWGISLESPLLGRARRRLRRRASRPSDGGSVGDEV